MLTIDQKNFSFGIKKKEPFFTKPLFFSLAASLVFHLSFFFLFRLSDRGLAKHEGLKAQVYVQAQFISSVPSKMLTAQSTPNFTTTLPETTPPLIIQEIESCALSSLEQWIHTPFEIDLEDDLR